MVLVGHSAGGGVVQYALSQSEMCRALCLVDAIPHFGALPVYANWARHDPLFLLRNLFHLNHPTSPLSSPRLVHGAFFSQAYPRPSVVDFMHWMPAYESLGWPMAMMGSFWAWLRGSPSWLDARNIIPQIAGSRKGVSKDSICVMLGSKDVLMDINMARGQVAEYRQASAEVGRGSNDPKTERHREPIVERVSVQSAGGARLVMVEGAGHHVQNDIHSLAAVKALLQFLRQC